MSVSKSVLQKKSDQELEKYVAVGNNFVPQANQYAYDILKSRGRIFTEEETECIYSSINEKTKKEEIIVHPNYKKSAHIIYLSGALGIINFIFLYSGVSTFTALFSIGSVFLIGYFINLGSETAKYVFLAMMILGSALGLPLIIAMIKVSPMVGFINIFQCLLQIWALILLFTIPKSETNKQMQ